MASSSLSCSCALVLILLLVAVTPVRGASEQRLSITTAVTECYPATTNATNSTAFRADVLSLLGTLPSAAAPTGFATLSSARSTFARGLCFGDAAPHECLRCLSAAAKNLTSSCGADNHRRAGIWSDGCFVSYADSNATTASEDALRPRVISGADPLGGSASYYDLLRLASAAQLVALRAAVNESMLATGDSAAVAWNYAARSTVRVLAQCARDRTAAECDRCLEYSAQVAASCCWGLDPWRDGVAAAVAGFNCYLRFEVSAARVPLRQRIGMAVNDYPRLTAFLAAAVLTLVVMGLAELVKEIKNRWMERKQINNARNAAAAAAASRAAGPRPGASGAAGAGRPGASLS